MAASMRCGVYFGMLTPKRCGLKIAKSGLSSASVSISSQPKVPLQSKETQGTDEAKSDVIAIDPLKHPDFFEVRKLFTVKDLFDARVHFGHKVGSLNDYMRPFLFGSRLGHLIFDLDQTAEHLRAALNFTAHVVYRSGMVMFVNRNPHTSHMVERAALECGEYAHTRHWLGGELTNANTQFGTVTRLPDVIICMSVLSSVLDTHYAVLSAAKMLIPTVGIVDTNCDPRLITYPVPGNDDTPVAVQLYCDLFKKAVLVAKQKRREMEDKRLIATGQDQKP